MEEKFLVGAATAAYQVEGNNVNSDFWKLEHIKHSSYVEHSLDSVDHYNRYKEDILLLKDAGLNAYRFSIEWARIEPKQGKFDEKEVQHYEDVLKTCIENGVTPVVTFHHFSTPCWVIHKGGWKKKFVINAFANYCAYLCKRLGKYFTYVCTLNEANMGIQLNKIAERYKKKAKVKEGEVQVGVNMDMKKIILGAFESARMFGVLPFHVNTFLSPRTQDDEKIVMAAHLAAKKAIREILPDVKVGLSMSLYDYQAIDGGEEQIKQNWDEEFSFYLPYIEDDDFLGVQNYSRKVMNKDGLVEVKSDYPPTQMGYEDYPYAVGNVVRKVSKYFKGNLIVTENGISTSDDDRRCEFLQTAFDGVMKAKEEGASVKGYFCWSLLDNYEWQAGFSKTFGLIAVDRKTQKRTPKQSLYVLGKLAKTTNEK